MKLMTTTLLASLALFAQATPAHALDNCSPSPNCGGPGKPCNAYINQGATKTLITDYTAGAAVIRVRLCLNGDTVCDGGKTPQAISIFGTSGGNAVYTRHLNLTDGQDTGPYTLIPSLTKLKVRCNSTTGQSCHIAWQHCKESLPVQTP